MTTADLCAQPLSEIAGRIARREVSPVEVTQAVLDRIARLEPELNAFITVTGEEALREARAAEAEIVAGNYRGPLHGVPITLKDLVWTKGIRTTAGSRILSDFVPERDATVAARLQQVGAVLVGKTNMLEFAYGEVSPVFGPTKNPWNLEYGTSGSSSGSGAAVAAGLGFGSLGSDTGGSIRLPAAHCGIVGLKPTYGRVSRDGVVPLSWSLDHVGPMTRTVRDCAIMLEAIAGHDPADPTSSQQPVPRYAEALDQAPARRPVIGVFRADPDDGVAPEVREACDAAAATLRGLGYDVREVTQPYPEQAVRSLLAVLYAEASSFHLPWLRTRADEYGENTRIRLELGAMMPSSVYLRALRVRQVVIDGYRELFRQVDLLVVPPSQSPSYRLDDPTEEPVGPDGDRMAPLMRFSCPFDLTGLPAMSVPAGLTAEGLPIGVQFVGRPFAEATLFQVADAFEGAQPDRVPRPAGSDYVV